MSRFARATLVCGISALSVYFLVQEGIREWLLVSLACAYGGLVTAGVSCLRMRFFCDAVSRVPEGDGRVALTFDDGPDPVVTAALLDTLRNLDVKATFFCIGEKAARYPGVARRIVDEGHTIANHSFRHAWWMNFLFGRALYAQVADAQRVIARVSGVRPRFFRPPMGLTNPHLAAVLRAEGLICVGWDVRSFDLHTRSAPAAAERILRRVRDGSIILLHDSGGRRAGIIEIVASVVPELKRRGLSCVSLDQLLPEAEGAGMSRSCGDD